jgi:S-(hydroxymethyl)glutathione dehydrogenase/alcohol dehydrogenase
MMKTHAAILREQPGQWQIEEVDLDDPGPTEVLVELVATGLCHSDDHAASGDMPINLPIVGGHEGAGIIRAIGSQVTDYAVGDHIVTSFIPSCGKCRWCAMGLQNLCDFGANTLIGNQPSGGYRMHSNGEDLATMAALGTFAEWQVFDEASIVKIDPDIPLDVAALVACGVPTGYGSAVNAADIHNGDVVIIFGVGGIGMNAVQGAAAAGASHIVVVDPAPFKREKAPEFGATEVFAEAQAAVDFVRSITNGQGADAAICTPGVLHGDIVNTATDAIRKGGIVVVTSMSPLGEVGIPTDLFSLVMNQKRIQGALYGSWSPRYAIPTLLGLYKQGKLKLDELVTNRYTLDQINDAYQDMRDGRNIRGVILLSPVAAESPAVAREAATVGV